MMYLQLNSQQREKDMARGRNEIQDHRFLRKMRDDAMIQYIKCETRFQMFLFKHKGTDFGRYEDCERIIEEARRIVREENEKD